MLVIRKAKIISFATAVITLGIISAGCQSRDNKQRAGDERVVARINNYELTAADFKEDPTARQMAHNYYSSEPLKAKEELLESMITKELLIQEAQRLNFDKDKAFMKEIENYWEQALLKLLIQKKLKEFSRIIKVDDKDVQDEYTRMKQKVFADLVTLDNKSSAQSLSDAGNKFDEVKESLKEKIISSEPADWYVSGDLPEELEVVLFSLKPQEISQPVKYENSWAVIRAQKAEDKSVEPLEKAFAQIKENIARKKREAMLEKWATDLRKNADVRIDKKALEEINLN